MYNLQRGSVFATVLGFNDTSHLTQVWIVTKYVIVSMSKFTNNDLCLLRININLYQKWLFTEKKSFPRK